MTQTLHGPILITSLSGFWWLCCLLVYRHVQSEAKPYRIWWWFSTLTLGVICLCSSLEIGGVIPPVNGATTIALIVWVSLCGGVGLLTWIRILCQDDPEDSIPDQGMVHHELTQVKVVV
jgi:hypothetical protein